MIKTLKNAKKLYKVIESRYEEFEHSWDRDEVEKTGTPGRNASKAWASKPRCTTTG